MIPKSIRRKIFDIEYLSCQMIDHQGQQLSLICLQQQCQMNRLSCCNCQQTHHKQHRLVPLKQYLINVYEQRHSGHQDQQKINKIQNGIPSISKSISSSLPNNKNNSRSQFKYLYYLDQIENHKIQALKQLNYLKSKFNQKIAQIQYQLKVNTTKWIDKIIQLSQVYFQQNNSLINNIKAFTSTNDKNKIENLIQKYLQNIQFIQNQNQGQQKVMNIQKNLQNNHYLSPKTKFDKINEAFQTKMKNFNIQVLKFEQNIALFMPKLSKAIQYHQVRFSNILKIYNWDIGLKAKNFEIDQKNSKIMRVKTNATQGERFALMDAIFTKNTKTKVMWAIKVNKLVGWIAVGLAVKKIIVSAQLKFNYTTAGHGSYLTSGNGYTWSHSLLSQNSKSQAFHFYTGDILLLQYDPILNRLQIKKIFPQVGTPTILSLLPLKQSEQLCPCVNMCSVGDQVQIVQVPKCMSMD